MTVGDRLKEERARIGMNQPDFAALAGTTKKSQITYEKGVMPDAAYLAAVARAGVDVQYIVTGVRRGEGIGESAVHQAVLDAVDLLSLEKKVDAQQLAKAVVKLCAKGGGSPPPVAPKFSQQFNGDVGAVTHIKGDQRFEKPVTIGVGAIHKKKPEGGE